MIDPTEWKQFLVNAKVRLTGASDAGIKTEFYGVAKEFFTDSNCWRDDISFQAQANVDEYILQPTDGEGQIIRLIGVWDGLGITTPAFMQNFSTLKLLHAPDTTPADPWFARVVKTVTQPITSDGLPIAPDWALRVYSEGLLDGLLGRMMAQAGKSYTNQNMSGYHLRRFRQAIKIARVEADAANTVGAQAWAFPGFAQGSQRGGVSTAWPTRGF